MEHSRTLAGLMLWVSLFVTSIETMQSSCSHPKAFAVIHYQPNHERSLATELQGVPRYRCLHAKQE